MTGIGTRRTPEGAPRRRNAGEGPADRVRAVKPPPHEIREDVCPELARAWAAFTGKDQRERRRNFAEVFSRALAERVAHDLREGFGFRGVLPGADGSGHESRARSSKGVKRLDVNYSTLELGLGLGMSIKTINFRDGKTSRYTKNYTRVDNELRAEAADYHERQPYSVLVALVFIPVDAVADGRKENPSSFAAAVRAFRPRARRSAPSDDPSKFEKLFLLLYERGEQESPGSGEVWGFDVEAAPPRNGEPRAKLSLAGVLAAAKAAFDQRNDLDFRYDDGTSEDIGEPVL